MPRVPIRLLAFAALAVAAAAPPAALAQRPARVTFDPTRPGAPVPRDFLGLSFEVKSLPLTGSYAGRGNLVGLLRSLGPGVLRFGGVTADTQVGWTGDGQSRPDWAALALQRG